jgi:predicted DNA-binding transcriptional regulator YafY
MRGDQLARQWRVIRAIEASSNGLTVAEIAKREETGIRTIYRDLDALRPKCHAKAQNAPREIFRLLSPFLDSFNPITFNSENNKKIFGDTPFAYLGA